MGMSDDCGCGASLAEVLGGCAFPEGGQASRGGSDGEREEVVFCLWCGQPNVEPELAESARFRARSGG